MIRIGMLAILLALSASPARADDRELCLDVRADADSRIAACGKAIASGQWSGGDLARLHMARAERIIFAHKGTPEQALADCDAALAADPRNAPAYRLRGVILYERGDYDAAIAEQNRALAITPRFPGALFERGRAYAAKEDAARALADYEEAIKINPRYAAPYNARGFLYYQQRDLERALASFNEAIRLDPKFVAPLYNRSRALARKRDYQRALADADEAIRIDPRYLNGYIQRGYVLKDMHSYEAALAAFDRAAEVDLKSPRPLVGRGDVLIDRKDNDRALAAFDAALVLEPGNASALSGRAYCHLRKGDLEQAFSDANEAIKRSPRFAGAYNHRALVLHARRDYDEAIADLDVALRIDPTFAQALNNRGRTYNAKKQFDRAIVDLSQAIELNPNGPNAYWNRAISYENKRDVQKALADWRTTLKLDPENQNAVKAIRRLEREIAAPGARTARVALVIGNADYRYGGKLANPGNDAGDIAAALRKLGFDVIEGRNLDKRGMEEKIAELGRKLEKASIGLFFYAGHGLQMDGDNWLVPVDARFDQPATPRNDRSAAVKTSTINVAQVVAKMEAEQRVNLIFLDACRDTPFGRGTGISAKGLAPIQNSIGTLTAYATKPHHVALDGEGRNSPFTTALLKHVVTPDLEIGAVMKRVRADVIKATKGEQVPFDESSLITDVVLAR
ncbi:MAG: tetratricopeptide repeat protein [Hyphomicrobiales bacterium]|nr:tetratricopeptide repeat protein [Hyphomicrobiales bacterium]